MKQKNKLRKGTIAIVSGAMLLSGFATTASAAVNNSDKNSNANYSEINTESQTTDSMNEQINVVENYIDLNSDGTISLANDVPESVKDKYQLDKLSERFDQLNERVKSGEIVINKDLSITEKQPSNNLNSQVTMAAASYSAQVEKHKEYWWGQKNWYNNSQTKKAQDALNTAAGAATLAAGLSSLGFPPGAFAGGVAAGYWSLLSSRMGAHNNGKGVTVSVTWALVFSVASR